MRQVILAAAFALVVPAAGWAQQPTLSPAVQALQQTVLKLTGEALDWQTQAIALQAQVADLQKQLADAKAKPQEPK